MKRSLALLLSFIAFAASAQQKQDIFADVAFNYAGASVTYDIKATRHLDLGAGMQVYNDHYVNYNNIISSVFFDIRPNWRIRRHHLLFAMADIGAAFYAGKEFNPADGWVTPVSPYLALGGGYGYMINKRGMGPYISFGMRASEIHEHLVDPRLAPPARDYSVFSANLVLSLGFKF